MSAVQADAALAPQAFLPEPPSRRIEGHGTPDAAWQAWGGLADLPPVSAATLVPPGGRAIIIAPHPDDEVLACGGLMQLLHAQGTRTVLLAVTDGDGSHPGSALLPPAALARLRPQETLAALRVLGLDTATPQVVRARIADGRVSAEIEQLQTLLQQLLRPGDTVFVTWRQDGHPDHEACGLAAALAARLCRATLVEMPVWSWHWAAPGDARMPWRRARRLELSPEVMQRKRQAVACFLTQLQDDPSTGKPAILPPHVLARLLHPYEIYFT
ncbi:PIG-L family deacetylase [Duganella sp. SAP-35]|uniref:PIG-L family deacetylase n=2 Tax=Duganella aceris TaxID=2703883 RepID=A0ABX0FIW4_9BURK|nr:PIG-L family deacetylase [Duganella aceris]